MTCGIAFNKYTSGIDPNGRLTKRIKIKNSDLCSLNTNLTFQKFTQKMDIVVKPNAKR